MRYSFILALLSIFLPSLALADKYTNNVSINQIEVLANGGFRLWSSKNISESGCYESGRLFKAYIGESGLASESAKNLLSVAMLAYSLDQSIDIYHGETLNCLISQIKISK